MRKRKLEEERKEGYPGDIVQTAYYERLHLGKHAKDPTYSDWVRTGTRFYLCVKRQVRQVTYVRTPLTSEERTEEIITCQLEHKTQSPGNYFNPFIDRGSFDDRWYLNGKNCATHRDDQLGCSDACWVQILAEEFECWWTKDEQRKLTCTQFAASCPVWFAWPLIDIILSYACPDFKDIGFPRPGTFYDFQGPVPRLVDSLGR